MSATTDARNQLLLSDWYQDVPLAELTAKYKLSERQIYRIVATHEATTGGLLTMAAILIDPYTPVMINQVADAYPRMIRALMGKQP